jgi:hypothetical protein
MHCIRFKLIFDKELYILHRFDKTKNESLISLCDKVITSNKEYDKNKMDIEIISKKNIYFFVDQPNLNIEYLKKYYNIMEIVGLYMKY